MEFFHLTSNIYLNYSDKMVPAAVWVPLKLGTKYVFPPDTSTINYCPTVTFPLEYTVLLSNILLVIYNVPGTVLKYFICNISTHPHNSIMKVYFTAMTLRTCPRSQSYFTWLIVQRKSWTLKQWVSQARPQVGPHLPENMNSCNHSTCCSLILQVVIIL